jgi:predicted  nucleic acid-binding Zn-ribbon protein
MLPILEQLLIIQDRDRRITQLNTELGRIPAELQVLEERGRQQSAKADSLRDELRHLEAERKKLEIDAEAKRAQIAKHKTQLYQIKSNTEYQALLREIANLEAQIKQVEDQELEFMEKAERLQVALREAQGLLQEIAGKADAEKSDLNNRAAAIEAELDQLRGERERLATQVDADALSRYERLLRSKGDAAVVPIQHGNCGGCHLQIPAQQVHDAKHNEQLTSCSYCGRILYWQPE